MFTVAPSAIQSPLPAPPEIHNEPYTNSTGISENGQKMTVPCKSTRKFA
jgi:hypothetical protein